MSVSERVTILLLMIPDPADLYLSSDRIPDPSDLHLSSDRIPDPADLYLHQI